MFDPPQVDPPGADLLACGELDVRCLSASGGFDLPAMPSASCRAIVLPLRTTAGPNSAFRIQHSEFNTPLI